MGRLKIWRRVNKERINYELRITNYELGTGGGSRNGATTQRNIGVG
jgi:hypothetical protein